MAGLLLDYIELKTIPFLIGLVSAAVNFGFSFVFVTAFVHGYKSLRYKNLCAGILLIALIYVLPQFIVEFMFTYPETLDKVTGSFLLYPSPLFLIPYYFIAKNVVKLPQPLCINIMEEIFSTQYIILILYRLLSDIWTKIINPQKIWPYIFTVDMYAMFCIFLFSSSFMVISYVYLRRHRAAGTPYEAPPVKLFAGFGRAFLTITSNYIIIQLFGILVLENRRTDININYALIYLVLIAIILLQMIQGIRKRKSDMLEWQKKIAGEYIQSLMNASDDLHAVRHDWNNILQVYDGYISAKDFEGLRQYHASIVDLTLQSNESFEFIASLGERTAVYTLLRLKIESAKRQGVALGISAVDDLVRAAMNDLDLCRVLGNLLDNAIDAAADTEEKYVSMKCRANSPEEGGGSVRISIENSARGEISLPDIYKKGYTQKPAHSGHGLHTVQRILAGCEGCYMYADYREGRFSVDLTLTLDPVAERIIV